MRYGTQIALGSLAGVLAAGLAVAAWMHALQANACRWPRCQ